FLASDDHNVRHFVVISFFFFSSRRRHTRWPRDWSSDVCSSDLQTHHNALPFVMGLMGALNILAAVWPSSEALLRPVRIWLPLERSEERRVGKECRTRWWRDH